MLKGIKIEKSQNTETFFVRGLPNLIKNNLETDLDSINELLSDIEIFKKHYSEPDHSDYMFFQNYVINNYPIPYNEKLNLKLDLCKRLTPWLKEKGVF